MIDWKKFDLNIVKNEHLESYELKNGDRKTHRVKFTNLNDEKIMVVTGDFGDIVFERRFVQPFSITGISRDYALTKTDRTYQKFTQWSEAVAKAELEERFLDDDYGYTDEELELTSSLIESIDYENEYTFGAAMTNDLPKHLDTEDLHYIGYKLNPWIDHIFDAFDEITKRCNENPELLEVKL